MPITPPIPDKIVDDHEKGLAPQITGTNPPTVVPINNPIQTNLFIILSYPVLVIFSRKIKKTCLGL
jgi:hypothetical protein